MLGSKFISDNIDIVKENIINRGMQANPDRVVHLDAERVSLIRQLDDKRQERNENAKKMKNATNTEVQQDLISQGKVLKNEIIDAENRLITLEEELHIELKRIPNMSHPHAPRGIGEKENRELTRRGNIPHFDFAPRDHIELGMLLDIFDFETAAKVTGNKFYYFKNEAVYLEIALLRYAMDLLSKKGFVLLSTPDLAREELATGLGFNPRGEESNIYTVEGTDICLIGTAEITLGAYHAGKTLNADQLPIRLAGLSHCFRREAGAAGKFSRGLYRVHQFTKLEMFVYSHPEDSDAELERLRNIEEEIFAGLDIPFRVVDTCTGDLGTPAYRKYDLEAWMPGRGEQGEWGEITSASNCTDYQARRLNTRYKDGKKRRYLHMLNGTAMAIPRAIISILENFQQSTGLVNMPPALHPYLGFTNIQPKQQPIAESKSYAFSKTTLKE